MDRRKEPDGGRAALAELTIVAPVSRDDPSKVLKVGSQLDARVMKELIDFLRTNLDVFARTYSDMCRTSPGISSHALNINLKCVPVEQKCCSLGSERSTALKEEVDKLKDSGFIRDALYLDWVSTPVLVKKANGNWRTCIDYSDLNKACPKDSFPLPRMDQLADSTAGHELLLFMDA